MGPAGVTLPEDVSWRFARGGLRPALGIAVLLLLIRFVLALSLIPPWQQPDEATHVALAELERSRLVASNTADPAREAEILQSMARYDWWQHRGVAWPIPTVIPERFGQPGAGNRVAVEVTGVSAPPAYFRAVGRLLAWLPRHSVVQDLYVLRALSAVLGMLTLLVMWFAAREFAGTSSAAVVTLVLAVHPQFAVVSTGATPDALTNLLAAVMWWLAAAVVRTQRPGRLLLVWGTAVATAAADRMGIPLVAVAAMVSVGVLITRFSLGPEKAGVALAAALFLAVAAIVGVLELFGSTYGWARAFSALVPVEGAMTLDRFVEFTGQLFRSWWYAVGWGRYAVPDWWVAVAAAITLVAGLGLGRRLSLTRDDLAPSRALVAVALTGIAIQLLAVYWAYFRLGNGAQGRYLFPMLVPSLILLWVGIEAWVPRQYRGPAAAVLVLLLAWLDASAWVLVALPAYYASL